MHKYRIIDKKTKQILYNNCPLRKLAKLMNVSTSTLLEHYIDRDNPHRFSNCKWRIERVTDNGN